MNSKVSSPQCNLCETTNTHHIAEVQDKHNDWVNLYGCPNCGAVTPDYGDKTKNIDEVNRQTEFHADFWSNESIDELDLVASQAMRLAKEIGEVVGPPRNAGLVVDLGCGRGNILHAMRRAGFDAIGCEASAQLVKIGQEAFLLPKHVMQHCDVSDFLKDLKISSKSINVAILWHVLEHLQNPRTILESLIAACSPDSYIFIELPLPSKDNIYPEHLFLATPAVANWLSKEFDLSIVNLQLLPKNKFIRITLTRKKITQNSATTKGTLFSRELDWTKINSLFLLYDELLKNSTESSTRTNKLSRGHIKGELSMSNQDNPSTLYIHIGFHKTGTSALQEYFFNNRVALRELDVIYPQPVANFPSHIEVSKALLPGEINWVQGDYDKADVFRRYRRFVDEAKPGTAVLISSEELSRIDGRIDLINSIKESFQGLPIKIVAYRRDPMDFLASLYNHAVRAGQFLGRFEEYLDTAINPRVAEFDRRLRGWKKVFGENNVIVRNYDELTSGPTNRDIVADMLEIMGRPPIQRHKTNRVNVGVHPWVCEAYRALCAADMDQEKRDQLKVKILNLGKDFPKTNSALYYLGPEKYELFANKYR